MANGMLQRGVLFIPFHMKVNQISELLPCVQIISSVGIHPVFPLRYLTKRPFRRSRKGHNSSLTVYMQPDAKGRCVITSGPAGRYVHVHIPTVPYRSRGPICADVDVWIVVQSQVNKLAVSEGDRTNKTSHLHPTRSLIIL